VSRPVSTAVVDVVLPCLEEAVALPWVLVRMPPGFRAIVVCFMDGDASLGPGQLPELAAPVHAMRRASEGE
jgi:hypothetical protein